MGLAGLAGLPGISGIVPGGAVVPPDPELALIVPAMTSANAPIPFVVTQTTFISGFPGWHCFDRVSGTRWVTSKGVRFVSIDFGSARTYSRVDLSVSPGSTRNPKNFSFQKSNDDSNWANILTFTNEPNPNGSLYGPYDFPAETSRYWRLVITDNHGDANNYQIFEIGIYG